MDTKIIVVLVALLTAATLFYTTTQNKDEYLQWKEKFGFKWTTEEDAYRRLIYLKNVDIINKHNTDTTQTYKMGINQFTGLTDEEFVLTYLNPRENPNKDNIEETVPAIADVDWVSQGQVSPIKNQGSCGSCWAFSAVAVLESWALSKGQTVNLSEQQLVDCSRSYGNEGCNGGFNYKGLAYVKDHGITDTASYPYTAKTGTCRVQGGSFKIAAVQTAKGCTNVATAINSRPFGVSADATNWSRYSSGIFSNCNRSLNHDIELVGYTSTYYKIKNSWGNTWGENGFIRLAPGNTCGICDDLSPWVQ
ncbi:unnamed protein product [Sphagnum balticum]